MDWVPATKQEVLDEIKKGWVRIDPALRIQLSFYLIDPDPALVERFGQLEAVFVVARINRHVVFFDDIEDVFGIANDVKGKLVNVALYGDIALALRELQRLGLNDC